MVRDGSAAKQTPCPCGEAGAKRRYAMSTVVCPDCQGAKAGFGIACGDRGCRPIERACDFCGGEGRVSPEANERWQKGRAARDARVKQRLSLFEKAAGLGLPPAVVHDNRHRTRLVEAG